MSRTELPLGAAVTISLAGVLIVRHGPRKIALVAITLVSAGMGTLAFGATARAGYLPTLFAGLAIVGMGIGFIMLQLTTVAVQSLAPHQVPHGSTLVSVNQQLSTSLSTALMSVILTSQFSRSSNITSANRVEALRESAARRGVALDPSKMPPRTLAPDFPTNLLHDLSHAYAVVFMLAGLMMAATFVPAAFLPTKHGTPTH
jgi:DHA2 family multidrug resistance protein